jgi:hypothetical protein
MKCERCGELHTPSCMSVRSKVCYFCLLKIATINTDGFDVRRAEDKARAEKMMEKIEKDGLHGKEILRKKPKFTEE